MKEGVLLDGKYRILELLGRGNESKVYLAENIRLGTLWAVKEIDKQENLQLIEPEILKRLEHPSLPRIYDVFEDETHLYIVVDYIKGTPLDRKLKDSGRIPVDTAVRWGMEMCDVLGYLHNFKPNPIVYRDMKPSNIIITNEGSVKLVDFGIAREYKQGNPDDTVYIGTRGYAAPEQYGGGQTSPASDIYSLGITIRELVTGEEPDRVSFEVNPIRETDPDLPEELERIIQKCTRKRPEERFTNTAALKKALAALYRRLKSGRRTDDNTKMRPRTFRRLVFSVWDNPEFGCEFAYCCAKQTGLDVLLVDLDLLSPSVDLYLDVAKYPAHSPSGIIRSTGLNMLLNASGRNRVDREFFETASVRRRELKNLYIITGSYSLEEYEYYSDGKLAAIIDDAYRSYDLTVLLLNRSIYDSFTVVSMARSDYCIVPVRSEAPMLRALNSQIEYIGDKQGIAADKFKFVVFGHEGRFAPDRDMMEAAVGDRYAGWIRRSMRREDLRNRAVPYAKNMEKETAEDYRRLLYAFGIAVRENAAKKIARSIKSLFNRKERDRGDEYCL